MSLEWNTVLYMQVDVLKLRMLAVPQNRLPLKLQRANWGEFAFRVTLPVKVRTSWRAHGSKLDGEKRVQTFIPAAAISVNPQSVVLVTGAGHAGAPAVGDRTWGYIVTVSH